MITFPRLSLGLAVLFAYVLDKGLLPETLCDTIKNFKVSEILHFLQPSKVAYHCLLKVGRRYGIAGSEIKDLIPHNKSNSQNSSIFFS